MSIGVNLAFLPVKRELIISNIQHSIEVYQDEENKLPQTS